MEDSKGSFCFGVDKYRFAIPLKFIDRVIRAVEIKPVPDAFPLLCGFVNYHGDVVPVLNFRYKTSLVSEDIRETNYLLLLNTAARRFFIIIETMDGVCREEGEIISPAQLQVSMGASCVLQRDGELFYLYDPDLFFSSDEQLLLDTVEKHYTTDKDHGSG